MQIQVISMVASVHRRAAITRHLGELELPFRFFDAIDGVTSNELDVHYVSKPEFPERSYIFRWNEVDSRELACTLSHMTAIRQAWQDGMPEQLLILEDDAVFCSVDPALLQRFIAHVPADAAYVQFGLTPADTIVRVAEHFQQEGQLYLPKNSQTTMALKEHSVACHCAAAYLITATGMRAISDVWFDGDRVIFPCEASEVSNNVALVADRLVFQAAVSQGGVGYVCTVPIVATTALDSLLHPNHVPWHQEARDMAFKWFETLKPMLPA